jgi:hypothetical protein
MGRTRSFWEKGISEHKYSAENPSGKWCLEHSDWEICLILNCTLDKLFHAENCLKVQKKLGFTDCEELSNSVKTENIDPTAEYKYKVEGG